MITACILIIVNIACRDIGIRCCNHLFVISEIKFTHRHGSCSLHPLVFFLFFFYCLPIFATVIHWHWTICRSAHGETNPEKIASIGWILNLHHGISTGMLGYLMPSMQQLFQIQCNLKIRFTCCIIAKSNSCMMVLLSHKISNFDSVGCISPWFCH